MHKSFDVLATWREKAAGSVEGRALPCGHYLPEECPGDVVSEFVRFFE
jgi:haloacetate dehalogenase